MHHKTKTVQCRKESWKKGNANKSKGHLWILEIASIRLESKPNDLFIF